MRKRLGNKGFSLLELLVGITMLAIIVVPVLHAFLTSSRTTVKAKELRNETVAAQNLVETYEATNIDAIIERLEQSDMTFGSGRITALEQLVIEANNSSHYDIVTDYSQAIKDGPGYKMYLTGVAAGKYDAEICLEANVKYKDINSKMIVNAKPMNAIYNQPDPNGIEKDNNPDVIAAKYFASLAQIDSGDELTFADFMNAMTRQITISIEQMPSSGNTIVISCAALFQYSTRYNNVPYAYDVNNEVYCDTYNVNDNGNYGMFFFYYPNRNLSPNADKIEIINRDNLKMNVYLVSQDSNTAPKVYLRELNDASKQLPVASIYANFSCSYSSYIGYPNGSGGYSDYWYKTIQRDNTLGGLAQKNRIYNVTVNLYKAGTNTLKATFDASSLE